MALLSIIFANYAYIKMFFTLLLWLTLWTPIIAIINYLNDLNLMKVAQVITQGKTALTMGTNMLIYKKIADNASFMNYLVMSTPVLAYAIAKASEQGFVTFASGLSQALQGSSRAAGSFANQQGLSTSSSISSPRGDEVYSRQAGIDSIQGALSASGGRFSTNAVAGGGTSITDANTGSSIALGKDGQILGGNISGIDLKHAQSETDARKQEFGDSLSNLQKTGTLQNITSSFLRDKSVSSTDKDIVTEAHNKALDTARSAAIALGISETEFDQMKGNLGFLKYIGGDINTGNLQNESSSRKWGKETVVKIQDAYNESLANEIANSEKTSASFNKMFSTSKSDEVANVQNKLDAYSTAKQYSETLQSNAIPLMVENYIQRNDLNSMPRNEAVAAAMKGIETLNSQGNIKELLSYANMDTNRPNMNGINTPEDKNLFNPNAVNQQHSKNIDGLPTKQELKAGSQTRNEIENGKNRQDFNNVTSSFAANNDRITGQAAKNTSGDATGELRDDMGNNVNLDGSINPNSNLAHKHNNIFNQNNPNNPLYKD